MAPETRSRSSSSKRTRISGNEEMEPDREPNKRQKQPELEEQKQRFPSKSCIGRLHSRFTSGEITPGRFVDLDFFTREGFQFARWFKEMNWVSVMVMKQKFYPELVRHFYSNLSYDVHKTQICSFVKGKEIKLNQKSLKKILGVPNLGTEMYDNNKKWIEEASVSRVEALKTILENPDLSEVTKINSCQLTLEMRLLHQMVVHIILPRKRSFNYVSSMDLLVMWHILKGKPFNLPFVLLSHMIACSEKKNAYLPYGMILTSIFNYFKVSFEGEESEELKSSDIYNEFTLHKLEYVKNERGWFLKKDKAVVQPSSEIHFENASGTEDAFPVLPDSTSQPSPSHDPNSLSVLKATSSAPPFPIVSSGEEGRSSEEIRQPSLIEGIFHLVKGMKEDMRNMTMDSKLDDLQNKIEHLRSLVTLLRFQRQERTLGDIFLLLEVIMIDMRNLRSKMTNFGNKIDFLQSQLTEFLRQRQDLGKVDRESMEWMIAETVTFRGQNHDIICRFETISSEIQDFWDCLSSRMGGRTALSGW
ncbi:hypothetical protein JCGZ_10039 [Jatropha curcas]|uniref:Putative plant transposon protein domain-containing protein n=1 Tax=Jatropha curcas TaxID=180498 RepID=A0A067LP14_JATCU|nr:uncharacterized protein LOC105631775 [Jatropha curcas]KDP46199.1 hypothetical protein JCGZ_10039 [Jatropha curcas]